jgi:hypothetical protein
MPLVICGYFSNTDASHFNPNLYYYSMVSNFYIHFQVSLDSWIKQLQTKIH